MRLSGGNGAGAGEVYKRISGERTVKMYYTCKEYYERKYDSVKREYAFMAKTKEEHESWREAARKRLFEITGMDQCVSAEAKAECRSRSQRDGYMEEYWLMQTEPGVYMPFYFLKPGDGTQKGCPTVLNPHGHGGGKEKTFREAFAVQLVKSGYCVVCPDERGSGERREQWQQGDEAEKLRMNSHREIQQMILGFGQCMVGLAVWDLMRLLDAISTWDCVDMSRIACAGMSGGGQQTVWLTALDDRIKAAITSGYFYGFKDSLVSLPGNCACNFVPNMWRTMDMGDMGAMIAPRPLFVESGEKDHLEGARGLANVYPQMETARSAYIIYGRESDLVHSIHDGGHEWRGRGMMEFLEEKLTGRQAKIV